MNVQIGQIWKSNLSPWTIKVLDIHAGKEWIDKDLEVVVYETVDEFVGENTGGRIYKNHLLQMFHLKENR